MRRSFFSPKMNLQNLFKYVRTLIPCVLGFLATCSLTVAADGSILFRLPPLGSLVAHLDQYILGVLLVIEWTLRTTPSSRDRSLLNAAARFLNALVPNRAAGGGHYHITPQVTNGPAT